MPIRPCGIPDQRAQLRGVIQVDAIKRDDFRGRVGAQGCKACGVEMLKRQCRKRQVGLLPQMYGHIGLLHRGYRVGCHHRVAIKPIDGVPCGGK